jgi:hypothetical protein
MHTHRHHNLGRTAAIVLAAAGGTLYVAATTLGASRQTGGAIQVFVTPSLTGHGGGPIYITGAIGDYGKSVKVNATGKPDPNGTYSLARLQHGAIVLNTSKLKKQIQVASERARPDLASCSLQGSTTATVPIISGTGLYAGISGSVRLKFTFAELAGRYTTGPHKGKCNLPQGPIAQWASIIGSGTVNFS